MRKNLSLVAAETVAIQNLRDEIKDTQVKLDNQKGDLRAMKDELKTEKMVSFNGQSYTPSKMRALVSQKLAAAKRCQGELDAKKLLLEAKEKSLDAAREQLASIRHQKTEMEVQIAQIEAELKTLRLAQTKSNIQLDDSRLARIKGALQDVRNQMNTQQIEADLVAQFNDETSIYTPGKKAADPKQIGKEVDEFLGGATGSEERVVDSKMPKDKE